MTSTVFVDQSTVIEASWLNDVDKVVYDNYSGIIANVRAHGAVGDGVTDDTAAIQATIALVEASSTGGIVYLPTGSYKVTANLTITWPKLCVIRGAGSRLTNILDYRTSVGTQGCVSYDAGAVIGTDDAYMGTWTGGFTLTKSINQTIVTGLVITSMGTGVGLYANAIVGGVYKDLAVHGYATNIYMVDCLGFVIRDVYTNQTNYGIYLAGYSAIGGSGPNAVIIENVIASACGTWGLYINGGMVQVLGGTYSDCGTMATVSGGICQVTDAAIGLPKTLTIQAAWFERNRGSADVYINNPVGTTTPGSFSISNSLFSRIDSTYYTTNNIYLLNNGNAYFQLEVAGNGFQGYNTYVANAGRKYVAFGGTFSSQCFLSFISNTFNDSTESPVNTISSANFSTVGFGSASGQLTDISGVPTLYAPGATVGLGNATGEMVLDATAWRPAIASTFGIGTATYPVSSVHFGAVSGTLIDVSGVPYLYSGGTAVGLGNVSGYGMVLDATAFRPSVASVFDVGSVTYPVKDVHISGNLLGGTTDSYTGTGTGFTSSPTATITYSRVGNVVILNLSNMTGTSNSTSFTITGGPVSMRPSATRRCIVDVADNGVAVIGAVNIYSTGVIDVYAGAGNLAFTAAGTKGIAEISMSYTI